MRTLALSSFLICTLLASAVQAQPMVEVVKYTVENNPQIGSVSANRKAVEQELRQARGLYLPQVDVVTGVGPEWTNDSTTRALGTEGETLTRSDARIQLTQRLFSGYETTHEVERQKARIASAANRVYQNAENIGLDAIGAYLDVIRQRQLYALSKQNVDFHVQILDKLRQRAMSGVSTEADVSQTRARLARSNATLAQTGNDLSDAEAFYTRVVGQFPGNLVMPEMPVSALPQTLDEAVRLAANNAPSIRAAEADVEVTDQEIGLTEAGFYPKVNLEADAGYNDDANGRETYSKDARVMVRARWNLFRGGIDRANRQEAVFRMHQARQDRQRAINEQVEQARRSWFAYQTSIQRAQQLSHATEDLKATRVAYQRQYDVGQRSLLDLLDSENELFTARGQLVSAYINQMVSSYRLLASTGTLLKTLQIAAPATSNPQAENFGASMAIE